MFHRLALALSITSAIAVADVRVVAPSGAPYTQIQDAVDAAQDGDVVLVRSGTYASFSTRNLTLAIVADTGAAVSVDGAIRVSGLGATRALVLSGLNATGTTTANVSSRHGLIARNCDGALRVFDCQLTGVPLNTVGTLWCAEGHGASLEQCDDVLFARCTLQGSQAPNGTGSSQTIVPDASVADGGHGVYSVGSRVTLYESTLRGGRAGYFDQQGYSTCEPPPYADGLGYIGASGEGYHGSTTFLFAAGSGFQGANGWNTGCLGPCVCSCANAGGNGLVHDNLGPLSAYLLSCTATGGTGGSNNAFCPCLTTGPCIQLCGAAVRPSGNPIVGSTTQLTGAIRRLSVTRVARELNAVTATLEGPPGDVVQLFVSDRPGYRWLLGANGVLSVRVRPPQPILQAGTIPPSGTLTLNWTLPDLGPGVESRVTHFQAAFAAPSGFTTLSNPVVTVALDSAF